MKDWEKLIHARKHEIELEKQREAEEKQRHVRLVAERNNLLEEQRKAVERMTCQPLLEECQRICEDIGVEGLFDDIKTNTWQGEGEVTVNAGFTKIVPPPSHSVLAVPTIPAASMSYKLESCIPGKEPLTEDVIVNTRSTYDGMGEEITWKTIFLGYRPADVCTYLSIVVTVGDDGSKFIRFESKVPQIRLMGTYYKAEQTDVSLLNNELLPVSMDRTYNYLNIKKATNLKADVELILALEREQRTKLRKLPHQIREELRIIEAPPSQAEVAVPFWRKFLG